jgi:acetyl-CoA acetyltransferase
VTAGNASQLSDGAIACVLMEARSLPNSAGSRLSGFTVG